MEWTVIIIAIILVAIILLLLLMSKKIGKRGFPYRSCHDLGKDSYCACKDKETCEKEDSNKKL